MDAATFIINFNSLAFYLLQLIDCILTHNIILDNKCSGSKAF
jgi:hypothetical protein